MLLIKLYALATENDKWIKPLFNSKFKSKWVFNVFAIDLFHFNHQFNATSEMWLRAFVLHFYDYYLLLLLLPLLAPLLMLLRWNFCLRARVCACVCGACSLILLISKWISFPIATPCVPAISLPLYLCQACHVTMPIKLYTHRHIKSFSLSRSLLKNLDVPFVLHVARILTQKCVNVRTRAHAFYCPPIAFCLCFKQ